MPTWQIWCSGFAEAIAPSSNESMWRSLDNALEATTVISKQMSQSNTPATYTADAYVQQLSDARARLVTTGKQLLDWLSGLDEAGASEFIHLEPMRSLFPASKRSITYRLLLELHLSEKRYGTLGVSLRTDSMRTDLASLTVSEPVSYTHLRAHET